MAFQPPVAFAHSPLLPAFLEQTHLPPILTVLQAHSRLKNVQTLTTSLQPVVHPAFGLRFVRLEEAAVTVEEGREDKAKWVDWVGARVGEVRPEDGEGEEMSWLEAQRCLEACAGLDGCVALVLIASTLDPSPIVALQQLYSTTKAFSDSRALLVFYLVITTSPADPTLLPSLQRTFGPHTSILSLPETLPTDTQITVPPPLPIPPLLHSVPPPSTPSLVRPSLDTTSRSASEPMTPVPSDMTDGREKPLPTPADLEQALTGPSGTSVGTISSSVSQAWHRFLREFVTQSLVPFMERTVLSLHESYTSRRALPSRLLSITSRRFFSSAPTSPSTTPKGASASTTSLVGTAAGDRRLIEWSAMLGDVKEVAAVGDGIRREGKAVEDILLLHTLFYPPPPPPASQAVPSLTPLAAACLKPPSPSTATSLLTRALILARADYLLISRSREGLSGMGYEKRAEVARWFVLGAGNAEEPLAALLLGRAAVWEPARRRKGMWYALAGGRMERCGLKPLALLYLRRSYVLYSTPPSSLISALATLDPAISTIGKDESPKKASFTIPASIPRALGRLLYTTHETHGAVRVFLDLLGQRCLAAEEELLGDEDKEDEVLLEDFRLSYQTLLESGTVPPNLILAAAQTWVIRADVRTGREVMPESTTLSAWEAFSAGGGLGKSDKGGKTRADVGRTVQVDITLRNPFKCDIVLNDVTVLVKGKDGEEGVEGVEVETLETVKLPAEEDSAISIRVRSSQPLSLTIPSLKFSFLSLLPTTLSLSSSPRRRLNDTPAQQRTPAYAPPTPLVLSFEPPRPVLDVDLNVAGEETLLLLGAGEWRTGKLTVTNEGEIEVDEVWVVLPDNGCVWVDTGRAEESALSIATDEVSTEIFTTPNALLPPSPIRVPLEQLHTSSTLAPGESFNIPFILHGQLEGYQRLEIVLAFRSQADSGTFYLARAVQAYEVSRLLEVTATVRPERGEERGYDVLLEVENLRSVEPIQIEQVTFINTNWQAEPVPDDSSLFTPVELQVVANGTLRLRRSEAADQEAAQAALNFLAERLNTVLVGGQLGKTLPANVPLALSYATPTGKGHSFSSSPHIPYLISSSIRTAVTSILSTSFPLIPTNTFPYIFPLYTPRTAWLALFFSLPTSGRRGCVVVGGLTLQAGSKLVEVGPTEGGPEKTRAVRSMYAETAREKEELIGAVRASGWAREEDPLVVDVKVEEGEEVGHDFATGPCSLHVTFIVRNFSPSRLARFTLRLPSPIRGPSIAPPLLPPPYTGMLVHKGSVDPMGVSTKKARLAISRTGTYALGGWRLEVEVGEREGEVTRFVQVGREGSVSVVQAGRSVDLS